MMIRILYIWSVRHPASGYLITPLISAFILSYTDIDYDTFDVTSSIIEALTAKVISEIEADTYWCLCKILDGILDNYTSTQPGVHKTINKIQDITKKIDPELNKHFLKEDIKYTHFSFRWVYCLLVREFPLRVGMRLFDSYISDDRGFDILHIYICAAIILKWSKKIKKMKFNELMMFLQNIPTKEWVEADIDMLVAEAHVFRLLYEDSKGHFADKKIMKSSCL